MVERSRFSHRSRTRVVRPSRSILRKFIADTRGAIFIQMIVLFLFLMGVTGLVLDVGRIYVINTSVQAYVDQIALAAATELDGRSGAIDRARLAAYGQTVDDATHQDNILRKLVPFGDGEDLVDLTEIFFISELPDDSGYQYYVEDLVQHVTTEDDEAEFVVVIAKTTRIATTLLRLTAWGAADPSRAPADLFTSAVAVAGLEDGGICASPTFMFCNPMEDGVADPPLHMDNVRGRMLLLKNHGQKLGTTNTSWAPGDYGTIDLPLHEECVKNGGIPTCDPNDPDCDDDGGNSAAMQRCLLGANSIRDRCVRDQTIDMDPGQSISIHTGLNLRFAIFDPQTEKFRDNPAFGPDANVIKGEQYTGKSKGEGTKKCVSKDYVEWEQPTAEGATPVGSVHLPRASCVVGGTCKDHERLSQPMPTADPVLEPTEGPLTDLKDYWNRNHGDHGIDFDAAAQLAAGINGNYYRPINREGDPGPLQLDTRYDMYLFEYYYSGGVLLDDVGVPGLDGDQEYGSPIDSDMSCVDPGYQAIDRRVFLIASVNCKKEDVKGNSEGVDVAKYYWAFLTEPVKDNSDTSSEDDIYLEFIRELTESKDPNILHSYPVLHR